MDFAEVEVDYQFHSHIIGKNGANGMILQIIRISSFFTNLIPAF